MKVNLSMNSIDKNWVDNNIDSNGKIVIPAGIEKIETEAFMFDERVTEVVMSDSIVEVGNLAFSGCTSLKEIKFSNKLERIGFMAFYNCSNLKSISLPESLNKIEVGAFMNCTMLTDIEMGTNINQIDYLAFSNTNVKSFKIPPKINIFNSVFSNCRNLEELYLGENIRGLWPAALTACPNLKKLVINSDISYFPETVLEGCNNLEEIELNGTIHIRYGSFQRKDSIKKIKVDGKEITLDESEEFFSLQQYNSKVAIVIKNADSSFETKFINLKTGKETKQDMNIYLANDGSEVRAYNSIADVSIEQLRNLQNQGEKSIYLFGATRDLKPEEAKRGLEYDLYNINDLVQVKQLVEDMKKEIIVPSKDDRDREKKIYAQIVRKLSEKLKHNFFEEYNTGINEEVKQAVKEKYEQMTGKSWEEYLKDNENSDLEKMLLEDGNLIGLLRGKTVCRGNVEIIRNIAAEFGIEATATMGLGHIWNQVKLDDTWYDDDFTNYNLPQKKQNFRYKLFLGGQIDNKPEFFAISIYAHPLNYFHVVGEPISEEYKDFLWNYGREQQEIRHDEQKNEEEWMNSFQACDKAVEEMQDGAKKKQQAVDLIRNLAKSIKNKIGQYSNKNQEQGR